mmetsp:Transcript_34117/g.57325  ORF Transcript_34117/g.57325 Transcript_34117/m.57325 type:complete len:260 (+) Transcript_34117:141-920(+)
MPTLGFIGCGAITEAVVRGLCTMPDLTCRNSISIVLSPRGSARSAALAAEFGMCDRAESNQEVIERADWVFIGLLAQQTEEILKAIKFKPDQQIVSMIPFGLIDIRPHVLPATNVVFSIPMPSVAMHLGPIAMFPRNEKVKELYSNIGVPVEVDNTTQLVTLTCGTAFMAPYYQLLDTMTSWMEAKGVSRDASSQFVGSLFHSLTVDALKVKGNGYAELTEECQTTGGLNEQALRELRASGAYEHWQVALESINTRMTN